MSTLNLYLRVMTADTTAPQPTPIPTTEFTDLATQPLDMTFWLK